MCFVVYINWLKISEIIQVGEFKPSSSQWSETSWRDIVLSAVFLLRESRSPLLPLLIGHAGDNFSASSSLQYSCFQGHLLEDVGLNSLKLSKDWTWGSHITCVFSNLDDYLEEECVTTPYGSFSGMNLVHILQKHT